MIKQVGNFKFGTSDMKDFFICKDISLHKSSICKQLIGGQRVL